MNRGDDTVLVLENEAATLRLGAAVAAVIAAGSPSAGSAIGAADATPLAIALRGPLGAGKTTLVRGFLRALGFTDAVRSPTYTLVERYEIGSLMIRHFDLYRLGDPEELEYLGERESFVPGIVWWVEWPSRGEGWLPSWSLELEWLERAPDGDPERREMLCKGALAEAVVATFRAAAPQISEHGSRGA